MEQHADGSPAGSQQGIDGAALALRMVQAAEAAAAAANAAGNRPESQRNDWYKMLPKPGIFDPKDREAELSSFRDWWWSVEQYLDAVDTEYLAHFDIVRQNLDTAIRMSTLTAEQHRRGAFLYGLLASLLKGRPLMMLKGIERGNGFEAVRQLFKTCQPSSRNRALGLLHLLMKWPEFDMKVAMLPQILKLEDSFREYERIGGALSGELKFAILMKCIGGQLKTYLNMTVQDTTTYENLRESILQYDQATIKWSNTMSLGTTLQNDFPTPMEVDRIKGKGKDVKGKGKGKGFKGFDKGSKGKGKSDKGYGKGQKGSWNQSKGQSWNQNQSNGGDKGGKASSKGKGNGGKSNKECWKCGRPGHFAKECRVRFVEEHEHDDNTCDHGNSQQQTSAPAQASNASNVHRISVFDASSSSQSPQLFFDIASVADFSDLHVKMISTVHENSVVNFQTDSYICESCSGDAFQHDASSYLSPEGDVQASYDLCCNGPFGEYIDVSCSGGAGRSYELCTLCKLDDFIHYSQCTCIDYGFALYDDVPPRRGAQSLVKRFGDASCFKPIGCMSDCSSNVFDVRAVKSCCDIILDSGSDATVIPVSMISAGSASQDQTSYLRDAQGARIATEGVRDISIVLTTVDGGEVTIRDKAHVSNKVECPLISYGKLLRHGWGIVPEGGKSFLVHTSGSKVDIGFKQNSLVVSGNVRMISEAVRVIDVDVPKRWKDLKNGWYRTRDNRPLCASHGKNFVDCLKHYTISDWPYRTTIGYRDGVGWQVIELCQSVFQLDDRAAPISGGYNQLVTVLSKDVVSIVDFGMVMSGVSAVQPVIPEASASSGGSSAMTDSGGTLHGLGGAQQTTSVLSSGATTGSRHDPVRDVGTFHRANPEVSDRPAIPTIPTSIAIEATQDRLEIAGVVVTKDSSIAVLKAACEFLAISQSGSKAKLWRRIIATVDRQRILEETQLSVPALTGDVHQPRPVQLADRPAEDEVQRHMLTHIPYAAWCEACVSGKGKPDRHERNETRVQGREIPVLSFDFGFTGKSLGDDQDEDESAKLTTLILHDSHSGSVGCIPLRGKNDSKHAVREMVKYLQYLGHGDICLMCDQEPSALAVQSLLQRTWQRMGFRVVIENAKVLDHGGNAWAEKSIDRIRSTAGVLIQQLEMNIGHEIPAKHPLFSWAFCHASWLIDRFVSKANVTAYELIRGHSYRGKLCQFGEPLMCYVADTTKRKGDARWRQGVFLGKSVTNDMYLVHCEGNVRLTRSVKSIYKDWSEHMGLYRTLVVQPWQIEGTLGNRIDPVGGNVVPEAIPSLDDEAAPDPPKAETGAAPETPALIPTAVVQRGMKPPPMFAAISGPVTPVVPQSHAGIQAERMPTTVVEQDAPMEGSGGVEVQEQQQDENVEFPRSAGGEGDAHEPSAKRQKLSLRRVGGEELCHMDVESWEYIDSHVDEDISNNWVDYDIPSDVDFDDDLACENGIPAQGVSVWRPISDMQPELPADELGLIDVEADKIEVQRLLAMNVIATPDGYSGKLDVPLSAKMVRTWRKKLNTVVGDDGAPVTQMMWMRRSRLVGRDFNFLEYREDVYSPASSASVVKLLPCMALSDAFVSNAVIATLDVSDAFLQVPQPIPRKVTLDGEDFIILKCLPGQRDASRLWYSFFVERLSAHFDVAVCPEQPCILRCQDKGVLLLHVDDVLICGSEDWISQSLIPKLEGEFKLTYTLVKRQDGGSLEFLKRTHIVEPNYASITISAEGKHASSLIERFSKVEGKLPRVSFTPSSDSISISKSDFLTPSRAAEYRSLVGIAMYLAQERFDLQYATKTLASHLQQPTQSAWNALGRLVGYLRFSEDFCLKMEQSKKGTTFMEAQLKQHQEREKNTLEVFTDSDWSGSGDMKSTSSAVHVMNGIVIHSTSRSQKCISLSSTEAEWYAASAGVCDAYYLQHIVEFVINSSCNVLILHTDNSAVRMLSLKFGVGRLRHIRGRLLWLQQKMSSHELDIRQIPTLQNVADMNTKSHSKNRFLALMCVLGFVTSKGASVGEDELTKQQSKEALKNHVKLVSQVLKHENGVSGSSTQLNQAAKHVLRVLSMCSLMEMASGTTTTMSPSPEALSPWLGMLMASLFTAACIACGIFWLFRHNRQHADDDDVYAPEEQSDGTTSVASAVTDYGFPLSEMQERIFHVIDNGCHTEEAICEWMTRRCTRRLAIADSSDRGTVLFYSDCLAALANARRNLLTCDDGERNNIFGYLRSLSRMSPRECSPTREMDMVQLDAAIVEAGRFANETVANLQGPEDIPMDDSSDISDTLLEEQRRYRYRFVPLEEASDPDLWQEVRHGGPDSSDSQMSGGSEDEPTMEPVPDFEQQLRDIHRMRSRALRRIRRRLSEARDTGTQEEIWALEAEEDWWTTVI